MAILTKRFRADIIALVDEYQAHFPHSDHKIGMLCWGHHTPVIQRLRDGRNVNIGSCEDLETWLRKQVALKGRRDKRRAALAATSQWPPL